MQTNYNVIGDRRVAPLSSKTTSVELTAVKMASVIATSLRRTQVSRNRVPHPGLQRPYRARSAIRSQSKEEVDCSD